MTRHAQSAFTLIEMIVTLLVLTMLSSVALRSASGLQDQARFEQTQQRLQMIREAILGDPRKTVNGQAVMSGFVADMGRLPVNLEELLDNSAGNPVWATGVCSVATYTDQVNCVNNSGTWTPNPGNLGVGWRGPYLQTSQNTANADAFTDGWGRVAQGYCGNDPSASSASCTAGHWVSADFNYGWWYGADPWGGSGDYLILSYGSNQTYDAGIECGGGNYIGDCFSVIRSQDYQQASIVSVSVNFVKPIACSPATNAKLFMVIRANAAINWYQSDIISNFTNCSSTLVFYFSGTNIFNLVEGDYLLFMYSLDLTHATQLLCEDNKGRWDSTSNQCFQSVNTPSVLLKTITTKAACMATYGAWDGTNCYSQFYVNGVYWPRSTIVPVNYIAQ